MYKKKLTEGPVFIFIPGKNGEDINIATVNSDEYTGLPEGHADGFSALFIAAQDMQRTLTDIIGFAYAGNLTADTKFYQKIKDAARASLDKIKQSQNNLPS